MSIYSQFGVSPIINAAGTLTRLGGAILPDAVVEAMRQAARDSVCIDELQAAASKTISRLTGTAAGIVTCGASSSLMLGAAAILCRNNRSRMRRLPDTSGIPNEFLVAHDQRSGYDHAVRAAGASLVEVGMNEAYSGAGVRLVEVADYEDAIGPATAGVLYVHRDNAAPRLSQIVEVAHRRGVPVLVDAAAELPPKRNLRDIPGTGADLVAFSGGKAIRGPQNTGILCGNAVLVQSAALQMLDMDEHPNLWQPPAGWIDSSLNPTPPRHGIGRGFKVAKEQIVGMLVALELFANGQFDAKAAEQRIRLKRIASALADASVSCELCEPPDAEQAPLLSISIDSRRLGRDAFEVCRRLRAGEPRVFVHHGRLHDGLLLLNLTCVREDQDAAIVRRLREEISTGQSTTAGSGSRERG